MYYTWYIVVWKLFDRKYFIDNKIQGIIFSWVHDFLEIFLPWTYITAIIYATAVEQSIAVKSILLIATTLQLLHTIYNLIDPVFYAVWGAVWLFWACMLFYWSEIISACKETTWQCQTRAMTIVAIIAVAIIHCYSSYY